MPSELVFTQETRFFVANMINDRYQTSLKTIREVVEIECQWVLCFFCKNRLVEILSGASEQQQKHDASETKRTALHEKVEE